MSRSGKAPIDIPKGVEIKCVEQLVTVTGPKGTLQQAIRPEITVLVEADTVMIVPSEGYQGVGNFWGLYRALVQNMVIGVTDGYEKKLELIGVGFRAAVKGAKLDLQLGFSHPLLMEIPEGISVDVEKNTLVSVKGSNKQKVGQFAADIRSKRKPEPYKGKGVRYVGEYVRKKAGKAGRAGK